MTKLTLAALALFALAACDGAGGSYSFTAPSTLGEPRVNSGY